MASDGHYDTENATDTSNATSTGNATNVTNTSNGNEGNDTGNGNGNGNGNEGNGNGDANVDATAVEGVAGGMAGGVDPTTGEKLPDPDHIKMFVGQLPRSLTEEECRKVFEEYGPIHSINMLRDKVTGQGKGCAFVTYYTRKAALDAQNAMHNIRTLGGMHNPIQMKPADTENRSERKLFVGMISKQATEEDIRKLFSPHGTIEECTILRDSAGNSRGCAFVTFASRQNSLNAIRVLHHSMTAEGCTSPMVVKMADSSKDKEGKMNTRGFGGRGGANDLQQTLNQALNRQYYQSLLGGGAAAGGGLNLASLLALANPQGGLGNLNILAQLQQLQSLTGAGGMNAGVLGGMAGAGGTDMSAAQGMAAQMAGGVGNGGGVASVGGYGQTSAMGGYSTGQQMQQQHQGYAPNGAVSSTGQSSMMGNTGQQQSQYGSAYSALVGTPYGNPQQSYSTSAYSMEQPSSFKAQLAASGNSPGQRQTEGPENSNLFIYHIPPEYGDAELIQLFSNFGQLLSARVFIDKQTGLSKCFGFASYDNPASAATAIATMNGFQVGSKRLKVQLKRSGAAAGKPY